MSGNINSATTNQASRDSLPMKNEKSTSSITFLVIFICWFTILAEGYDLGVYGPVLPALMKEWGLAPAQAGFIGSYALIGMLLGSLLVGIVTDIIGRKKVLVFCLTLFSLTMGLAAMSTTPEMFAFWRFIAGLGIGGVIPSCAALTLEYSPPHRRTFYYVLMASGYSMGAVVGALAAIFFLEELGWRALFWIGVAPILVVPVISKFLPESIGFLLAKDRRDEAEAIAKRYQLSLESIEEMEKIRKSQEKGKFSALKTILSKQKLGITTLFTLIYFTTFFMAYGLLTWLPKIMQQAGYPLSSSLVFLFVYTLTALIGSLVGGYIADYLGAKRVLGIIYFAAAVSIFLLSLKPGSALVLYCLIGIAGFGAVGTTGILTTYLGGFFTPENRGTAVGTGFGIGRIGAALGPVIGGYLLSLNVDWQWSFYVFALAGLVATVALLFIPKNSNS